MTLPGYVGLNGSEQSREASAQLTLDELKTLFGRLLDHTLVVAKNIPDLPMSRTK